MGIFRLKKHSVLIPLLSLALLTGCETVSKKFLTVDTVRDTIEIVDDTLKYLQVDSKNYETNLGSGYTEIFDLFTGQDYIGSYPRDFNYDDEPFLQFRYLKGIVDNLGDNFVFGKKYYDTQAKDVYFDFSTETKNVNTNYLVVCSSFIAADIRINSFNQIYSNVVFLNTYTLSNGVSFTTNRYVSFLIDYDYGADGTSFLFKIYTRNDELEAPYVGYITYQYDHIRVVNGSLVDYRKFNIEVNTPLVPDENHTSFEDYVKQGVAYRVDAVKWFVDGTYYVSKYMTELKQTTVGNVLFSLGMFEPFSYAEFISNYDNNESITTSSTYRNVSSYYGDDLQYAFLTRNQSTISHINEANNPYYNPESIYPNTVIGIEACDKNKVAVPQYTVRGNVKFKELFTSFVDMASSTYVSIPVWHVSKNEAVDQISSSDLSNTSKFTIYFKAEKVTGESFAQFAVSPSITIKQAYEELAEKYDIISSDVVNLFSITILEKSSGYSCSVPFAFGESLAFLNKGLEFPETLINYGVPEYTGSNIRRYKMEDTSKYENGYGCYFYSGTLDYLDTYFETLELNGFTLYAKSFPDISGYPTVLYSKKIDSQNELFIKLSYSGNSGGYETYWLRTYHVEYSNLSNLSTSFPSYLITAGIPNYDSAHAKFDDQSDAGRGIFIYDSNNNEVMSYCSKLLSNGFDLVKINNYDGYMVFKTTYDNGRYFIFAQIDYYEEENCDYHAIFWLENNPNYFNIENMYLTSYFDSWNSSYASSSLKLVSTSSNYFTLSNSVIFLAGKEFKFIANGDWSVSNPSTSYNGFGYDDVYNISSYSQYFSRGSNGKIIVVQNVSLMVKVNVYSDHLEIFFTCEPANIYIG